MTSILTNGAAISALQTLRSISSNLDTTQRMVSSGMRIQIAADNAAYWSISTTMKSDRMAISAVSDALSLGAAKVDTAYAGMNAVIDVLHEFKAKLVAATEDGVDKAKIQTELDQLKKQVVTISTSASFSGQNWLNTDVAHLDEAEVSVVSSFVREPGGSVAVKTAGIGLDGISLFNSTGGGLLQSVSITTSVTTPGGLVSDLGGLLPGLTPDLPHYGHSWFMFAGAGSLGAGDRIDFDVLVDANGVHSAGSLFSVTIDQATVNAALGKSDGSISDPSEMATVLRAALLAAGVPADSSWEYHYSTYAPSGTLVDIYSTETIAPGLGSSIVLGNVTSTLPGNYAFGMETSIGRGSHNNIVPSDSWSFSTGFQLTATSSFSFDVNFPNLGTSQSYTVTQADIDAVLGNGDGIVADAAQMASVLNAVIGDMSFVSNGSGTISAEPASSGPHVGRAAMFNISNVTATDVLTVGTTTTDVTVDGFDFLSIDITDPASDLDDLISAVETMSQAVTSGAAILGALSKRIDMQKAFTERMMATVDSGVGRLVDADMNEVSTRLKAIQTQQQLAIQSLSIANTSAEHIAQLFR